MTTRVFNLDATLSGADWIKGGTWDLLDVDSGPKLNSFLYQHGLLPKQFMRLPIFVNNVDQLPWLKEWADSVK